MTTRAQIESNRRNAVKSTGPKTERGKERSCRNALQDGLTGTGAVVVPTDEAEVDRRIERYREVYAPTNVEEENLLRRLAWESLRMERCVGAEVEIRADMVRRAALCWDEDRAAEAETIALGIEKRPRLVVARLRTSLHGCWWLYDRWVVLRDALETKEDWDEHERTMALDLLGIDPDLRVPGLTPLDAHGDKPPGERHFALAESEIVHLAALIDGPMSRLDEAARERAVGDRSGFDAPALERVRRVDRKAFQDYNQIRKLLQDVRVDPSTEREQPAEAPPVPAPKREVLATEPIPVPRAVASASASPAPSTAVVRRDPPAPSGRPGDRKRRRSLEKKARKREALARRG